jgi:hypothetical protein
MKMIFLALAAVLGALAVVFVFLADYDKAFVAAAAGAVAWLLNYRQALKEQLPKEDEHEEVEEDEVPDEEVRS